MKEISIKVLTSGYYITVKIDGEIINEFACNQGRHNIGKFFHEHLDGYVAQDLKPTPIKKKKKTKKRAIK